MEDTKIFKILRFAADQQVFSGKELMDGTGFSWLELRSYASVAWPGVSLEREGIFELEGGRLLIGADRDEESRSYQITYTAMMHWLDYIELKEARAASLSAQRSATKSINIAVAAIVISSVLALAQIVSSLLIAWRSPA